MKEKDKKLDVLLSKAGQMNIYQFQVTLLFLIQLTCAIFFDQCLPFLERGPYVFLDDSEESVMITNKICKNGNYRINEDKLPTSIVIDFEIFCNDLKMFYLGLMLNLGMIIGACSSYLFIDKMGRKKTLVIFTPIYILFLCTFKILTPNLWEHTLILIYLNIFFLGITIQIIIIAMIIYICEIIKQTDIIIFVILTITGVPLSNLLGTLLFNIEGLDWRDSLLIVAVINIIIYVLIILKLVGSPIFSLNNELYDTFILDLIELGKKNGVKLSLNDFEFLNRYMSKESRRNTYERFMTGINRLNTKLISKEQRSESYGSLRSSEIEDSNSSNDLADINMLKDDYLLSNDENNGEPLKLFGKLKMKDYSPLDLIRFKKQIKNFSILSFLWLTTTLIKNGINLHSKYIQKMNEEIVVSVIIYVLEILLYFLFLFFYFNPKIQFHSSLIMLQIISFIVFMIIIYINLDSNENYKIILLYIGKLCWACMFALISVITAIIYPIMIRTKGYGWNKSSGFIGGIIAHALVEFLEIKTAIFVILTFEFFTLTLSYGLPKKIGTFILESPSVMNNNKDKDNENENENDNDNDNEINDTNNIIINSISSMKDISNLGNSSHDVPIE